MSQQIELESFIGEEVFSTLISDLNIGGKKLLICTTIQLTGTETHFEVWHKKHLYEKTETIEKAVEIYNSL